MANEEHLKILKQGVKVWNKWREENPDVEPDLLMVDLCERDLSGANLSKTNLVKTKLSRVILQEADLRRASLIDAGLWEADLRGANLCRVFLNGADLSRAKLDEANLREADLRRTRLIKTSLCYATLTGVVLYGTSRDDWIIDGVQCDFVYWVDGPLIYASKKGNRIPKDRDFRPREFEALYKQLPTFEYYFEQGFTPLDPLIMDRVVQAINQQHPEIELKLDSFHSRGQAHAVFTVLHKEAIEEAKQQVTSDYKRRIAALEGQQGQLLELFSKLSMNPQPQLISGCEQVIIGGNIQGDNIQKTAGRDYLEHVESSDLTTGNSQEKGE